MSDTLFTSLFVVVIVLDLAYLIWFVYGALKHDMLYISMKSMEMYVEVAKAVIVSAGIVSSVLASAMLSPSTKSSAVRPTIAYLGLAIVFSVFMIMILTRACETAIGRELRRRTEVSEPVMPGEDLQGKLHWFEFVLTIVVGGVALGTFMLGILYLIKLAYE